jgi:hypothetical protein
MPVRNTLNKRNVPGEQTLRDELRDELTNPKSSGEPDIVIESPHPSTVHLYVIWSKWDELEQMVRSRIILDAYSEAKGEEEVDKVTVAMGLTPSEAERLGVK